MILAVQLCEFDTPVTPAFVAASAGGDRFPNTGLEVLWLKNTGGVDRTVTVQSLATCSQGHEHDVSVLVPAGTERVLGGFARERFTDAEGYANLTYSAATGLLIGVFKII